MCLYFLYKIDFRGKACIKRACGIREHVPFRRTGESSVFVVGIKNGVNLSHETDMLFVGAVHTARNVPIVKFVIFLSDFFAVVIPAGTELYQVIPIKLQLAGCLRHLLPALAYQNADGIYQQA